MNSKSDDTSEMQYMAATPSTSTSSSTENNTLPSGEISIPRSEDVYRPRAPHVYGVDRRKDDRKADEARRKEEARKKEEALKKEQRKKDSEAAGKK